MKFRNAKHREDSAKDFEEAADLATKNGMQLRALAYANSGPEDVTQYRIEGDGWFKDIYPGTQRIYCPDKSKQGPFVSMKIGKRWGLVDLVNACIKAVARQASVTRGPTGSSELLDGNAEHTRILLAMLIGNIAATEGTEPQGALRDLLTDLRHVSDHLKLDYHSAEEGAYDVYLEEKADPEFSFDEPPSGV
jgi:hypothetical protein